MSENKVINVGVIGTGMGRLHIDGYSKTPGVKVKAVCDINREEMNEQADKFDIPLRFTDYRELLAVDELDAVSVVVPNDLHKPMTLAALDRGLHVLCEKPMATNADDAAEMVRAAESAGKRLMINMTLRFVGRYRAIRQFSEEGRLGEVYHVNASMIRRRGLPAAAQRKNAVMGRGDWFITESRSGGGAMMDIGVHVLDIAWWVMDNPKPKAVMGNTYLKLAPELLSEVGKKIDVDEMVTAHIKFEGGGSLQFTAAWCSHMKAGHFFNAYGTKGGVSGFPLMLHYDRADSQKDEMVHPPSDDEVGSAQEHFIECIRDPRKKMIASGKECLQVARILDAIKKSARTGREVAL